jgi:hypothetical protein
MLGQHYRSFEFTGTCSRKRCAEVRRKKESRIVRGGSR